MKKVRKISILLTALFATSLIYAQSEIETAINGNCGMITNVSIYGDDNREEYCKQNIIMRELADSVAALFADDGISIVKNGEKYTFGTRTLKQAYNLSNRERFLNQPAEAFCSGFLVGDDLLATAGHCVKDDPSNTSDHAQTGCNENTGSGEFCKNIKIVFGYRKELGGFIPKEVSEDNVYSCLKVIAHSRKSGPDYAIIKLDRKVTGRHYLAINRRNSGLKRGSKILVMGHPSGLPLKIAGDAQVIKINETIQITLPNGIKRDRINKNYSFLTNLDTFGGNSGSPVINAKTLLVEGILVAGDRDYKPNPDDPFTNIASTYPYKPISKEYGKGIGEVVTKISVAAKYIPFTKREKEMIEMNKKAKGDLYKVLMNQLMKYSKQYQRNDGIIPIPNFTPDGNGKSGISPAIYYPPNVPEPTQQIKEI